MLLRLRMKLVRGVQRGLGAGFDYADDGDGNGGADLGEGQRGGGVAGDDEELGALGDEEAGGLDGVAGYGVPGFGAVGKTGGVAEVEEVGTGEAGEQGAQDSEAAEAGVEDADGSGRRACHHWARGLGEGVAGGVGAEEVDVAGEGFARLAVDEEADLFDLGEVGVEGADDGAQGEGLDLDAGGVGVDEVAAEVDDGEFAAGGPGLEGGGWVGWRDGDGLDAAVGSGGGCGVDGVAGDGKRNEEDVIDHEAGGEGMGGAGEGVLGDEVVEEGAGAGGDLGREGDVAIGGGDGALVVVGEVEGDGLRRRSMERRWGCCRRGRGRGRGRGCAGRRGARPWRGCRRRGTRRRCGCCGSSWLGLRRGFRLRNGRGYAMVGGAVRRRRGGGDFCRGLDLVLPEDEGAGDGGGYAILVGDVGDGARVAAFGGELEDQGGAGEGVYGADGRRLLTSAMWERPRAELTECSSCWLAGTQAACAVSQGRREASPGVGCRSEV